jgi:hypothetical protein
MLALLLAKNVRSLKRPSAIAEERPGSDYLANERFERVNSAGSMDRAG